MKLWLRRHEGGAADMIIDFHQHIIVRQSTDPATHRTAEHVLAHLRHHGGGKVIILPNDRGESVAPSFEGQGSSEYDTELALDAWRQWPDEIVPFCHVNPLRYDALDAIRRYHRAGARGFGEHKVRLAFDHPACLPIYRLCGELGLPVLIHFQYGVYSYNFEAAEAVFRACPETVFIGHAQAWWANVSAAVRSDYDAPDFVGYPPGPVVRGGLTDRWLEEYPNVYGDLSAGSGWNALTRDPEFGPDFVRRHRSKLLWATDCYCLRWAWEPWPGATRKSALPRARCRGCGSTASPRSITRTSPTATPCVCWGCEG